MFGYVIPDKKTIKQEEFVLFSAFYCGICTTIGNKFGQALRYSINYDIAFFAALIFDQLSADAQLAQTRCVGNALASKPIIKQNLLLERIADVNIILIYFKLVDNLIDGKRGAKTAVKYMQKHFDDAQKREPQAAQICKEAFERQQIIEKNGEKSVDRAADCFAMQLKQLAKIFLGDNQNALALCYNVGKFVYLADALDDIADDAKRGAYNPFLAAIGGNFVGRKQFILANFDEISFALVSTVNRAIESFNGIRFNQSYGLIENIVYYGLREKTDELLKSTKKLKKPRL